MIILYRFLLGITCYASVLHATDLYDPDPELASDDVASDSKDGEDSKSAIDSERADDSNTENDEPKTADTPNEAEPGDSSDADLDGIAKSAEDLLNDEGGDDAKSAVSSTKKKTSALAEGEASEMQDKLPDLAKMFG